jgi:hypothetical protein
VGDGARFSVDRRPIIKRLEISHEGLLSEFRAG